MSNHFALVLVASICTLLSACDSDESPPAGAGSGASSGGASGGGGATSAGGMASGGATASGGAAGQPASCEALPQPTTVLDNVAAKRLSLAGDELVFIDLMAGDSFIGGERRNRSIRKVRLDGSGAAELYAAPAGRTIVDAVVDGAAVLFLETERPAGTSNDETTLYTMPVAGGAPTKIALHDDLELGPGGDPLDGIVGFDASNVYVIRATITAGSSAKVFRIDRATGSEQRVVKAQIDSRPTLVGSDFYFRSGALTTAGEPGLYGIAKVPASATDGTPEPLGNAACDGLVSPTPEGIVCTGAREAPSGQQLSRYSLSGDSHALLFSYDETTRKLQPGPSDGAHVYAVGDLTSTKGGKIYKVPLDGSPVGFVACDRREIDLSGEAGNPSLASVADMVLTPTEIIWVETRKSDTESTAIYRVAR